MTQRLLIAAIVLLASCVNSGMFGAEYRADDHVVVKADEVIDGDLYASGETVLVAGTVKGDLVAAARNISVEGYVEGDLIAAGQTILVNGKISDDARIAGAILKLGPSSRVGGDLFASGCGLECEPGSEAAADVVYAGIQALLAGKIGRDLHGCMANCRLDGEVGRNASIEAGGERPLGSIDEWWIPRPEIRLPNVPAGMSIGPKARVGGKLSYSAIREAKVDNAGAMAGGVEYHPLPGRGRTNPVTKEGFLTHVRGVAGTALFALLAVLFMPRWTREMSDNLRRRPVASFFCSFLGVIAVIALLALVVALTIAGTWAFQAAELDSLAVASVFVGIFSSLVLIGGYWFSLLFLAPAIVGTAIGRLLLRSPAIPTLIPFLIGLIVLVGLTWIPVAGVYLGGLVMLLGFGAFCVWLVAGPPPEVPVPAAQSVAVKR